MVTNFGLVRAQLKLILINHNTRSQRSTHRGHLSYYDNIFEITRIWDLLRKQVIKN